MRLSNVDRNTNMQATLDITPTSVTKNDPLDQGKKEAGVALETSGGKTLPNTQPEELIYLIIPSNVLECLKVGDDTSTTSYGSTSEASSTKPALDKTYRLSYNIDIA